MKKITMSVISAMILIIPAVSMGNSPANANPEGVDYQYGFELGNSYRGMYLTVIDGFWGLPLDINEEDAMGKAAVHIEYLEEMWPGQLSRYRGLADALGVDLLEVVVASIYLPPLVFRGCTTSASAPPATDGGVYLSWNLDIWGFWGLKQLITLPPLTVTAIPGKYKYITFGIPLIAGIGLLNEKGLALVGNACGTTDCGDGLTALEIPNMIMEQCSNVREAAKFAEDSERFSSSAFSLFNLNYLWADEEGGICTIEATHDFFKAAFSGPDEPHLEYVNGKLVEQPGKLGILGQGNHHQYLDYGLTGAPSPGPDGYESSWIRATRMWDLLRENYGQIDVDKVKSFTADTENGVQIGPIEQGGFNSICRTMPPFGWIDYYIGSLTGKYVAGDQPAILHDLVIFGPDQTNWALVIEPKEKIIWWAAGWSQWFPYHPIYCAPLLGVDGPSGSAEDSIVDKAFNLGVNCFATTIDMMLAVLPPALIALLGNMVIMLLRLLAKIMEGLA